MTSLSQHCEIAQGNSGNVSHLCVSGQMRPHSLSQQAVHSGLENQQTLKTQRSFLKIKTFVDHMFGVVYVCVLMAMCMYV